MPQRNDSAHSPSSVDRHAGRGTRIGRKTSHARTGTAALMLLLAAALLLPSPAAGAAGSGNRNKNKPRAEGRSTAPRAGPSYAGREDAMRLADEVAARRRIDRDWVRAALAEARFLPNVPRLMLPPARPGQKNWNAYRARFVDPVRIDAGVRFWRAHAGTLARAEAEFGVPAEIIVGIIGVETIYGRQMGNFRVLDALATLSLDFPDAHPRAEQRRSFFREELESFLDQQRRSGSDPTAPLGSYAGAMGMPQFMPSSQAKYAIDFDGDGRIDLAGNPVDVIGSVANYFKAFGWQRGMPATYPVRFDASRLQLDVLLAPDILPSFSADAFVAAGALLDPQAQKHPGLLALIELQNAGDGPVYVAGTQNFYVITRYNWSSYYAMSVLDLGRAVRQAMADGA